MKKYEIIYNGNCDVFSKNFKEICREFEKRVESLKMEHEIFSDMLKHETLALVEIDTKEDTYKIVKEVEF